MAKRILIFIPCFTYGGAEKQGIILARALRQKGYEVHLWAFPPINYLSVISTDDLVAEGIHCYQFPSWPEYNWNFADIPWSFRRFKSRYYSWHIPLQRIKSATPKQKFDVVIPFTEQVCFLVYLLKEKLGAGIVYWNHVGGSYPSGFNYSPFLINKIRHSNLEFMANSQNGAAFLGKMFSRPTSRIRVIHNFFIPETISAKFERAKLKTHQRIEMLHIANLFPEKDWETLVEGMALLKSIDFACHLHMVGAFVNEKERERFFEKVKSLGVSNHITYHGSMSKHQIVGQLLDKIHIGVLSSKSEGMPNAVMEYMYWKLPVVATDIPGIRELLGNDNTDCLFKVGNANEFAEKVQWLASDESRFEKISFENHKRILEQFSLEKILPLWMDAIRANVKADQFTG